jgi:hypothetical protein
MKFLTVGRDKTPLLSLLRGKNRLTRYLLIDDGEIINQLSFPKSWHVERLDFSKHHLDILKDTTYERASLYVDAIEASFPAGANTLTKQDSPVVLLEALMNEPKSLDTLIRKPKKTDSNGHIAAYSKIQRLQLSPVLSSFLSGKTNFSLSGVVLARLDNRLTRFDRIFLANLLASAYQGQVIITNLGQYACDLHRTLLDENRLIAGVNFLDEVPFKNDLLLVEDKVGLKTTAKDAETLADYCCPFPKGTKGYSEYIEDCM